MRGGQLPDASVDTKSDLLLHVRRAVTEQRLEVPEDASVITREGGSECRLIARLAPKDKKLESPVLILRSFILRRHAREAKFGKP